jgi:hypothetical protein
MDAPAFLDWSNPTQSFIGLMDEWQARSHDLSLPITTWIVEKNGAQRFLMQYEHFRRWQQKWRVQVIPHETERNKSDAEYGVQTLASIYRYGLVRLPTQGAAYHATRTIIEEVTHYPGWRTDDTVMAQWFLEWNLRNLVSSGKPLPRSPRPSWLSGTDTFATRRQELIHG